MIVEKNVHIDWCEEDLKATPNGIDIWEDKGRFYFTWESAMREAESQGLRLPTKEDWEESFHIIGEENLFDFLKLNYAGYRYWGNCQYYNQGSHGFYWSSTQDFGWSYYAYFSSDGGDIVDRNNPSFGFSVRCIKN